MARWYTHVIIISVALLVAFSVGIVSQLQIGFKFSEEQLKAYNKLNNCISIFVPTSENTGANIAPSEDIEVNLQDDVAFFSVSDIQHRILKKSPRFMGIIPAHFLAINIRNVPKRHESKFGKTLLLAEWNPIGISLLWYQGWDMSATLYIFSVNANLKDPVHPEHSVVIHRYVPDAIGHNQMIQEIVLQHPLLHHPNDVAGISPTEFYVTNDHTGPFIDTPLTILLDLVGIPTGNVLYCNTDKKECKVVADGLSFANSVYMSPDHSLVYVTETIARNLLIYTRDPATNELSLKEEIYLGSLVDNINVDPEGNIWVAGTMDGLSTMRAINDLSLTFKDVPQIVFRLSPKRSLEEPPPAGIHETLNSTHYWIEPVWAENSGSIAPISVAAPTRLKGVILGSPVAKELIHCEIP